MSAVIESLRSLEATVANLENSAATMEAKQAGTQRDMFGGPDMALDANGQPVAPVAAANIPEAEVIARRLDFAITKVEELLKEEA